MRGDGLIFRHYELTPEERERLGTKLALICRQKGALFFVAGDRKLALRLRADGLHLPHWYVPKFSNGRSLALRNLMLSASVHNVRELIAAMRAQVDICLLSPILPTASHAGAQHLGTVNAAKLVQIANMAIYGLGGINQKTKKRVCQIGFAGFAGTSLNQ